MIIKRCQMSRSRLMGVVLVMIIYNYNSDEYIEFFNIEYTEFGLERFEQYKNLNDLHYRDVFYTMFQPLGSEIVDIDEYEAQALILNSYSINPHSEPYMEAVKLSQWYVHKNAFNVIALDNAIYKSIEKITSVYALINFFIMRFLANDSIYLKLYNKCINETNTSLTLIRNSIEARDSIYFGRAVCLDKYYSLIDYYISVDKAKITNFRINGQIKLSDFEVANFLKTNEFVTVYNVNIHEIENIIIKNYPFLDGKKYPNGTLFIAYNNTNEHLNKSVYKINDDIDVVIFCSSNMQLIISSANLLNLQKWEYLLNNILKLHIDLHRKLELPDSTIFEFANSDYNYYDDFISLYQII